jgi:hypothetical protein
MDVLYFCFPSPFSLFYFLIFLIFKSNKKGNLKYCYVIKLTKYERQDIQFT